jgi:predicted alpha/beta-fold hydrolase
MSPNTATSDDDKFHECINDQQQTNKKDSDGDQNEKEDSIEPDDHDTDDEYRLRVYGAADKHNMSNDSQEQRDRPTQSGRLLKRMSERFSKEMLRRRSSFVEALPETPAGWAVLASAISSACLGYEVNLQKSLTAPPTVYGQIADETMMGVFKRLTASPGAIFCRNIQPTLFVGTRGVVSSTAAYLVLGPAEEEFINFREVLTMSHDGAKIALDWELPPSKKPEAEKIAALKGPLMKHVVVILHGINNHARFGYMKALMRACTKRGWAAVGMNFRGCGGVELATPRGYNGAYTGDLRAIIHTLDGRMTKGHYIFVVGNSLGANLITKYLGECGSDGSLPERVAGGISLGNPLHLHGRHIMFPWGHILSLGARKTVLEHFRTFRKMKSTFYQDCIKKALLAPTLGDFDEAMAPIFIRNNAVSPFEPVIGYKDAEEYWTDASSYRYIRHVSVPFLLLSSEDDFLVKTSSTRKLHYCLGNPNVIVVNTRCGGHLGWHESSPDGANNIFGFGTSWADTATADFIDAILQGKEKIEKKGGEKMITAHQFKSRL